MMKLPSNMDPAKIEFDLFSSAFYLVAHADFKYHQDLDAAVEKFGLDGTTYRLLTVLRQASPINIRDLADLSLRKRSTVSRALTRMTREGWVETTLNRNDNRLTDVRLTKAGRKLASQVMVLGSRQVHRAVSGLSRAELGELTRLLKHLIGNLDRLPIEGPTPPRRRPSAAQEPATPAPRARRERAQIA